MATEPASTIPSPLPGGSEMRLRWWLPHVFTQRADANARSFGIYWSEADGLGRLHPQPTPEELRRFYDTASYDAYMGDVARGSTAPAPGARPDLLTRLLQRLAWQFDRGKPLTPGLLQDKLPRRPGRICDLGCGGGAQLLGLAALGHDVLGVDPNPVAIESGRRNGLRVLQGTAEDLPADCPRGTFDLVLMSHSLEHCLDPLQALRHATSLLAPGGVLVCEVPNHACAGFLASGPAWFHTDAGRHLWFFTPRSLATMAGAVGLQDAAFEFDGFARQFRWLVDERGVWDALFRGGAAGPVPVPPRPSRRAQIGMLLRALTGPDERRYDSVRMIARKP